MAEQKIRKVKSIKKRKMGGFLLPVILGVVLGVLLAVLDVDFRFLEKLTFLDLFGGLLLFYLGIFLAVNIHELGHLIFGKLLGYELLLLRVGPFSLQKENGKFRFSIVKNVGYGGLCAMIPDERSTLREFAVYSLGGIVFNLLSGSLFLYLGVQEIYSQALQAGLLLTGAGSILLGLINTIPFYSMNQPTDGMMFFSILRNSPMAQRFYKSSLLSKKLASGVRPRELHLEKDYQEIQDVHDLTKAFYLYFQEMDLGNTDLALEFLHSVEQNIDKVPPFSLPAYYYEILYTALLRGDMEKVTEYLGKAGKILEKDQDINGLRVKAYYAYFLEKDVQKAKSLAEKGLLVKDHYPYKGQAVFEADALEKLLVQIESESLD